MSRKKKDVILAETEIHGLLIWRNRKRYSFGEIGPRPQRATVVP